MLFGLEPAPPIFFAGPARVFPRAWMRWASPGSAKAPTETGAAGRGWMGPYLTLSCAYLSCAQPYPLRGSQGRSRQQKGREAEGKPNCCAHRMRLVAGAQQLR